MWGDHFRSGHPTNEELPGTETPAAAGHVATGVVDMEEETPDSALDAVDDVTDGAFARLRCAGLF